MSTESGDSSRFRWLAALLLGVLTLVLWLTVARRSDDLVVYCAHDSVFADAILKDFQRKTGIPVTVRYDTEATKSLGLVELLVRERRTPRCDVFWNNELLGMADLAEQGILEPYQGSGWERIPAQYKDAEGRWTGFAARFRVIIRNTQSLPVAAPVPTDPREWALAKPLYGTTLTHFTVLWGQRGADELRRWHDDQRARGIRILNGNGAVKDAVAEGACPVGYTDTDDFFAAKDANAPVAMEPVRLEGRTISIPNTVAVIQGSRRQTEARRLVDYLLSAETEVALARSASRQVPLGPVREEELPAEVRAMRPWVADGIPLGGLGAARKECLAWLKAQYAE